MANDSFSVRFDYDQAVRDFRRELDNTQQHLLPKALANMLNRASFDVRGRLQTYTNTAVDKPNRATQNAWMVVKAKSQDGDRMFAEVRAKEMQAQYLWFIIRGGTRKPGDVGTNKSGRDIFGFTAKLSQFGGVDRKYIKKLSRQRKAEKAARAALRTKRAEVINNGSLTQKQQHKKLQKLRWQVAKRGKMGIFIGTVHGVKGIWQRPERYLAEERQSVIGAARSGSGRQNSGRSSLSWTKPGQSLKLLVGMEQKTKHKAFFKYDEQVADAFNRAFTQERFNEAMAYQKSRITQGNP